MTHIYFQDFLGCTARVTLHVHALFSLFTFRGALLVRGRARPAGGVQAATRTSRRTAEVQQLISKERKQITLP
jgi:hypothetical protein